MLMCDVVTPGVLGVVKVGGVLVRLGEGGWTFWRYFMYEGFRINLHEMFLGSFFVKACVIF